MKLLHFSGSLAKKKISENKKIVNTQDAMMDGEEGTTKYAKGAKLVVKSDFR
jgi:hypothetical protein